MMNPEGVFRGLWCVDSETGERVLVNLDTNKIILKFVNGKIRYPEEVVPPEEPKPEGV
jgi:hypothetical protein